MHKINIAIDGYSSCGKGTLAKFLAQKLGYIFIDSGAMYRAVTLYLLRNEINYQDRDAVKNALAHIDIHFDYNPERAFYETYLNTENVELHIRTMAVAEKVSPVSAIPEVRRFLVAQQQKIGSNKGVVMDGRDIGTVVFPDAELKIFMTASTEVRAHRRLHELQLAGSTATLEEVFSNLSQRDEMDSTRNDSPLRKAEDARLLDNTHLTREEQSELAYGWVNEVLKKAALGY